MNAATANAHVYSRRLRFPFTLTRARARHSLLRSIFRASEAGGPGGHVDYVGIDGLANFLSLRQPPFSPARGLIPPQDRFIFRGRHVCEGRRPPFTRARHRKRAR